MGFAPGEVAAGVREIFARLAPAAQIDEGADRWTFRAGETTVTVAPLPAERAAHALFQPRTLLVVAGEGPLAESIRAAVRTRFMRVMG
jgi:hypothetical protein